VSEATPPTLGSKIDALLTPFVEDETNLKNRLSAIQEEAEKLEHEKLQINEDLGVVQAAKIDALRQAAEADPLLSAVFGSTSAPKLATDEGDEAEGNDIATTKTNSDGHPLLSHAS